MGVIASCVPNASNDIARETARLKNESKGEFRLVLLGAGESGKSTLVKQAMLIHGRTFSKSDRITYRTKIAANIVNGAKRVWDACSELDLAIVDPSCVKAAARIEKTCADSLLRNNPVPPTITPQLVEDITLLMNQTNFQKAISLSHKFQLEDTWPVFIEKLQEYPHWGGDNWKPSDEEILLSRNQTTGVHEESFVSSGSRFTMVDVGGQRAERSKWMMLLTGIGGMIFVSSLSAYNQTLYEANNVNRLTESLNLFKSTTAAPHFKNSMVIVFLNKFDLFQDKYYSKRVPLRKPLPSCPEPPKVEDEEDDNCQLALNWFTGIFQANYGKNDGGKPSVHATTALDRDVVSKVLDSTIAYVLQVHVGYNSNNYLPASVMQPDTVEDQTL